MTYEGLSTGKKITYKGRYGTVTESQETVGKEVYNDFTEEWYLAEAVNVDEIVIRSQDQVAKGDIVMTSSGEFDVDALRGHYSQMNHDCWESRVVVRFKEFNGDNYIPEKSHNGGAYLHTFWEVLEVKASNYIE